MRRLVAWADVVVDNAGPGTLDERGHGPNRVPRTTRRSSGARSPATARTGPTRIGRGTTSPTWRTRGCWPGSTRAAVAPASGARVPTGGLMAVAGITAALFDRSAPTRSTPRHQPGGVDDLAAQRERGHLTDSAYGIPVSPARHLYQCSDRRWITTAADEPRTWTALGPRSTSTISRRRGDPRTTTRRRHAPGSRPVRHAPAAEWVAELGPSGVPISFVHEGSTLVDDPQVRARHSVVEVAGQPVPANRSASRCRRASLDDRDHAASGHGRGHRCRPR